MKIPSQFSQKLLLIVKRNNDVIGSLRFYVRSHDLSTYRPTIDSKIQIVDYKIMSEMERAGQKERKITGPVLMPT